MHSPTSQHGGTQSALKTHLHRFALLIAAAASLLSAGCGTTPSNLEHAAHTTLPATPDTTTKVADRQFSSETFYALMVAEIAIDRRRYDIALGNYVQQATATRDPEVAARATQIARILKSHQSALEMAQLWEDLEPENEDAQMIVAAELIDANRLEEAATQAVKLLNAGKESVFDIIAIKATETDINTVRSLIAQFKPLTKRFPKSSALLFGYSILLQYNDQLPPALDAAQKAMKLAPDSVRYAYQESRVLQQMGQQDLALNKLRTLVEANPDKQDLRAKYARILSSHDINESRRQFEILHQQAPNDLEILYSLGLVEKESGYQNSALKHFQALLESGHYTSAAHYHLGMLNKKSNNVEMALEHFVQVEPDQNFLNAIIQSTEILVNSNKPQDALQLVQQKRQNAPNDYIDALYILEADILSGTGQVGAAETVLTTGLQKHPKSTKLLYARAMLFTRTSAISAAEQDLKAILSIAPNNAAALNALGYTLADKTNRIDEAYEFIKRALKIAPNDPAVLDSLGWVEYRRGNNTAAIELLTKAMNAMPDHEIAAHLGEVLWVTGKQKKAISIWKQGLELNPQSPVIQQTIQRLNASTAL